MSFVIGRGRRASETYPTAPTGGSGSSGPVPWTRPNANIYNAPSSRNQWILLTSESAVNLPSAASVQEADVVVIKVRSLDNPCVVTPSPPITIENPAAPGDFSATSVSLSTSGEVARWKYTANSGQTGAEQAYILW